MSENGDEKSAYICGPLTDLPAKQQIWAKRFYTRLADVCREVTGKRAFVPHEHYDPQIHAKFTPQEVDCAERKQVCENTAVLVVVAIAPSWGGGIEVEMAHRSGVPIIIICERGKIMQKKISRLLLGNPSVAQVFTFETDAEAFRKLKQALCAMSAFAWHA